MKIKTSLSEKDEIGKGDICNSPQQYLTLVIYIEEVKRDSSYKWRELHKSEHRKKDFLELTFYVYHWHSEENIW